MLCAFVFMGEHIHKSHNKSLLVSHFVCQVRFRRIFFTAEILESIKEVCLKIGLDWNQVDFLMYSVPSNSSKNIISAIKSITEKEILRLHLEVKRGLWGGKFWKSCYYVNSLARHANEEVIKKYFQNQGKSYYEKSHSNQF